MRESEQLTSEHLAEDQDLDWEGWEPPQAHSGDDLKPARGILNGIVIVAILALAVALWLTMAHAAEKPIYRPDWASCPGGWRASGNFCIPNGPKSPEAIPKPRGKTCPIGWRASGGACIK